MAKIMSESLSNIGIPLEEMASNAKAEAVRFLRNDATLDQFGLHLYKYLFFKDNSSIVKELRAFLRNLHKKLLVKQSIKNGKAKTMGLHFSGSEIFKKIDDNAGALHADFFDSLGSVRPEDLVNTELSELDNFTEMGFSLEKFEHPDFGTHLVLKFRGQVICDSVPNV